MNKLANSSFEACKEIAIGASQDIIDGIYNYFIKKGLRVALVEENKRETEKCDVVIHQIDWEKATAYFSPFELEGYSPQLLISIGNSTKEQLLDLLIDFLEGIQF